jgi:hypothetical protein
MSAVLSDVKEHPLLDGRVFKVGGVEPCAGHHRSVSTWFSIPRFGASNSLPHLNPPPKTDL